MILPSAPALIASTSSSKATSGAYFEAMFNPASTRPSGRLTVALALPVTISVTRTFNQRAPPGGQAFQDLPQLEDGNHLKLVEMANEEAATGNGLDEFVLLEKFQGVDERRAADPQVLRQFFLGDLVAGQQLPLDDHGLEDLVGFLIEVLVLRPEVDDTPSGGCPGGIIVRRSQMS